MNDDTPIIILTAYDWSDIEAEAKAAGVTAFCPKPMFLSDLRDSLMTAIGQKPEEQQGVLPKEPTAFAGKHILLAEDNELNREIAVEILNATALRSIPPRTAPSPWKRSAPPRRGSTIWC